MTPFAEAFYVELGSTTVPAHQMMDWIVDRVAPIDERPGPVETLHKQTLTRPNDWDERPLTDADQAFLNDAWVTLPHFSEATARDWPQYAKFFQWAKSKAGAQAPAWEIKPTFRDLLSESKAKRSTALTDHRDAVESMLEKGNLKAFRIDGTPTNTLGDLDIVLPVEEARKYLAISHFKLVVGPRLSFSELYVQEARARIAAGRCTLHEAAEILSIEARERSGVILDKLETASLAGVLPVYEPGRNGRCDYLEGVRVRPTFQEAYTDDLKSWLEANESRIKYRFPAPVASPTDAASEVAEVALVKPLPNWKMQVQAQAALHWKTLRATGANPTVGGIVDSIATWCRANNIKSSSGIFPNGNYLRTHVLAKKHWTPPCE